jgi:hypothetical protein
MAKGSSFERDVCKRLSLWWTSDKRDDIFWRTASSGARATQRRKQGKRTANSYGDVCATDPIGQPLIDLLSIELKRGYNRTHFADPFDAPEMSQPSAWESFVLKASRDATVARSFSWMLITRRDRHRSVATMPKHLFVGLQSVGAFGKRTPIPFVTFNARLRAKGEKPIVFKLRICLLDDFLDSVTPAHVRALAMRHKHATP